MKFTATTVPSFCLLLFSLTLSACASPPALSNADLIGTWRWVSVDGHRVPEPFYIRYYPNGKVASWPAPRNGSDAKGVSRGGYSIANGYLILKTGSGADDPRSRIQIQKDQMTLTTDEGHRVVYRRVLPAIAPGKLEDGSPACYAKHPM